jgi:hypothetical protein
VDVSALTPAASLVKIEKVWFATAGMAVNILWDATTPVLALPIPADASGEHDFTSIGGLVNPKATGYTGDIKFTTVGHTAGDSYLIVLQLRKVA